MSFNLNSSTSSLTPPTLISLPRLLDDRSARGMIGRTAGGGDQTIRLPPRVECFLAEFDAALQMLNQSVPALKAPHRHRLCCLYPGGPAGHRPGGGAAPRHLRHTSTARCRRSSSGNQKDDERDRTRRTTRRLRVRLPPGAFFTLREEQQGTAANPARLANHRGAQNGRRSFPRST